MKIEFEGELRVLREDRRPGLEPFLVAEIMSTEELFFPEAAEDADTDELFHELMLRVPMHHADELPLSSRWKVTVERID